MSRHRIYCINKQAHLNPHEQITHIGGFNSATKRWTITQGAAIAGIESGQYQFYVELGGNAVDVVVASRNGRKYLRTTSDGLDPNNLLSLPECP